MKKNLRSYLALFLSLFLLLCLPTLSFAEEEEAAAEWRIDESGDLLYYGQERYLPFDLSYDYLNLWDFSKEATVLLNDRELSVAICDDNPDMVLLYEDSEDYTDGGCKHLYYKESALAEAKALLEGEFTSYKLNDEFYISKVENALIEGILSRYEEQKQTVEVFELENADQYELLGYFKMGLPLKKLGVFLDSDKGYYYVSYQGLTNDRFTSDGKLSTREGQVSALLLTEEESAAISDALYDSTFTNPTVSEDPPTALLYVFFFIGVALFGIFSPLLIVVFAVIMLVRKKTLHPARYVALGLLSIAWIVLALLVALLILI